MPRAETPSAVAFDCVFCLRPSECPSLPTVDEDGEPLHPTNILEIYNDRRYAHYLRDFDTAWALRDHLELRCRYWCQSRPLVELEQQMTTIAATVEWWETARRVRRDAQPRQAELAT